MKKSILIHAAKVCLPAVLTLFGMAQAVAQSVQMPMRTVYDMPAVNWASDAIPLGNGWMGAMVYGGVYSDVVQLNEHTLWSARRPRTTPRSMACATCCSRR